MTTRSFVILDIPLPSHSQRKSPFIDAIILHDSEGHDAKAALRWMADPKHKLSMHYLIDKDGTIFRIVGDQHKAWHSGVSSLHGRENVNEFSLGVCLIDTGPENRFPDPQMLMLVDLCAFLCEAHDIPINKVVGHCHVAGWRKTDPGAQFPWFEFLNTLGAVLTDLHREEDQKSLN